MLVKLAIKNTVKLQTAIAFTSVGSGADPGRSLGSQPADDES